ncbi:LysR substrate-binding domain-containing protein [Pseudomonas sp. 10B1]|uniref:LysR family transcriptional regulator n=1 Tax=unclassified Pseudomonas TaxID=196821 RepID=UPI002AB368F6|nr:MULTISPECIES: LysR substrate-binding domain-containing protein [unclassified Pseudomonas]MDY7559695.1 LysR substrate-binding domain-containing protein [Pseudomonas sp. AB6]MEA9977929.1 LysR substrate-binding domain-containing protein [Pseudomonas sp. RTS4]MEA9993069.1 LysR substrate-binding domain-containing protein [Pseudomonas sp. AA4]MEB0086011.1 LysR substrate-binding domain-containing protein [Pseudomonas sp. RTI1]MEB0125553.1 LysR substrate-binding domain-containing protein [Pseudomon
MEIRHFRYFLAVAKHRNFTRAAEQLGIAPPTLTRQIQDLENELGTRVFLRQQREVSLTDAGRALQVEAELAVRQFETAQLNAQRAGRGETGHIELGYVASAVFSGALQQQVSSFRQRYPDIGFAISESLMPALPTLIEEGRLDVGYIRSPMHVPDSLSTLSLVAEGFTLAVPDSSWLCRLKDLNAVHLQNETFILPEQISGTLQVAAHGGFAPTLGPQPGGLVSVIALVSLGQGVAVVPESVVDHINLPNVVYRRIQDCQPSSCLSLVYRRFEKAPAVAHFIEHVKHCAE